VNARVGVAVSKVVLSAGELRIVTGKGEYVTSISALETDAPKACEFIEKATDRLLTSAHVQPDVGVVNVCHALHVSNGPVIVLEPRLTYSSLKVAMTVTLEPPAAP